MTRKRLAVVGNGMATSRLLDDLVTRDGLSKFAVSVFGDEPHGGYNRILLGRVLAAGDPDAIVVKPAGWYAERGVVYHPGVTVTALDTAARTLTASDNTTHAYDAVVLAAGSVPFVPPVEGLRGPGGGYKPGVHAYRTIADCDRIRADLSAGCPVVVVGGGLLGLEAAKALADLGAAVTVVHRGPHLMNAQVDETGGRLLRRAFAALGVTVRTGTGPAALVGECRVTGVTLTTGDTVPAAVVVFACGIRPRVELAAAAGVPVNNGVVVDDTLATAVPGVWAVGECAEHRGTVYGIVSPIYDQCAVLADGLTGADPRARYHGSKLYTRLKVAGVEVASLGVTGPRDDADDVVVTLEDRRGVYRKLVVRDGRLIGAVLVGDTSAAPALVRLLDRGDELPENRLDVLASGAAIPGTAGADPEVCNCHHVCTSVLVGAARSGCDSLPKIAERTKAGTGCGSCRGQLADLILRHAPATAAGRKG